MLFLAFQHFNRLPTNQTPVTVFTTDMRRVRASPCVILMV